jgi:hypothetical protein
MYELQSPNTQLQGNYILFEAGTQLLSLTKENENSNSSRTVEQCQMHKPFYSAAQIAIKYGLNRS